ncbi:hypothetical protein MHB48_03770 [Psychrobacillus sp. FSL H8-0483]|uniref:hypothetical protein n=1 Tax=Psychrobacillus sp. FSL H8-0483 TaxID=2921389 RepID=UPI00315A9700
MEVNSLITKNKKIYQPSLILTIIGIFFYRISLDWIYVYQVNPVWAYSGFTINFDFIRYFLTWLVLIALIPFISKNYKSNKPSSAIITIFYLIAFIPASVLMAFKPMDNEFIILFLLYWVILSIYHRIIPYFNLRKPIAKESHFVTNSVLIIFSLVVIYISYKYTNFRINLNIFNVYELREEAKEFDMFIILKYLYSASRVVLPTLIVYFLVNSKKPIAFWLALIQLLIFSVDGSKSVLFSLILAFSGYFIYRSNRISWFVWLLLFINVLAILEERILETTYIMTIFIRRLMFLPQLLNYFYFDFFSKNEFDYFRQSIIGNLGIDSPYIVRIPIIIGENYYGSSANNGLFSDAFYNIGIIGILIMPFLIILALRLLDACTMGLDSRILIASIITTSLNLISSSFFTVLLSHGFLALCLILYYLPRKEHLNISSSKQIAVKQ